MSKDDTSEITIEIAIFVDKDLFQTLKDTFPQDTEEQVVNVVTAMMDAVSIISAMIGQLFKYLFQVQILFEDGSLGSNIKLALKRIEIMRDDPDGLERSSDIQKFLDSFCQVGQLSSTHKETIMSTSISFDSGKMEKIPTMMPTSSIGITLFC